MHNFIATTPELVTITAIVLLMTYILVAQYIISKFIMHLFEVDRITANWFSYVIVVVLVPAIMYYYFYYTPTPITLLVLGIYSVLFLSKQAYERQRIVSSKYNLSDCIEASHVVVLSSSSTQSSPFIIKILNFLK
jgi:hypothetical protein